MQSTGEAIALNVSAPFLPGRASRVARLDKQGAVNDVFRVGDGNSFVVVRLNKERNVEESLAEFRKERWCLQHAELAGIPSPVVLEIGENTNRSYMVQTWIEGDPGDRTAVDQQSCWRSLGQYARTIHGMDIDSTGVEHVDVDKFLALGQNEGLCEQVRYNIESLGHRDELLQLGVYDRSSCDDIARTFDSIRDAGFVFGLCHGDLSPRNVIIAPSDIMYLLDWGCATVAPVPHYDIVAVLIDRLDTDDAISAEHLQAFLDGYGIAPSLRKRLLVNVDGYLVLKSFDLVRWALDRKPERTSELAKRAHTVWSRSWHNPSRDKDSCWLPES